MPQQPDGLEDIGFGGGFDPADAVAAHLAEPDPGPRNAQPAASCIRRTSIR